MDKPSLLGHIFFGWTDRLLPPEVKKDPRLHMQTRLALFLALPGTVVTMSLISYATTLTAGGFRTLLPFFIGQPIVSAAAFLMLRPKHTQTALSIMGTVTALMTVYGSYISGGLATATIAWFAVVPVFVSLYAGRTASILGTIVLLCALLSFWVLTTTGHQFPQVTAQTPLLWSVVVGWGVITTAGISIYSQTQFQRAVNAYSAEIKRRTGVEQSLRHAQQRLRLAKGAAEAGASAKGAFLAQVSHEIRNPLTAIMGTIDLLELPADEELRAARIDLLRRSAGTLLELVDDVLDFSKIESGRLDLNPKPIDPVSLAEEIERSYRIQAVEKGLELYLELDPNLPQTAHIDALRVRQVIVNLMSNALKFTPEGSITIEVWNEETVDGRPGLTFGIEDTGIGIPQESQALIFEPYMQAERSTTEQYGGTGLGLPICSRLVTLMGGELGLETEVGEGTRFWFTIPTDMQTSPSQDSQPMISDQAHRSHVLVVEDDPLNRQVVGDLLESLGHTVTLAASGDEGVACYMEKQPDLVLMDIQMPEVNGMEASHRIRTWETHNNTLRVPILAMTADVEVHRIARYGEAGMNDLLGKPISREKLEKAVKGWAVQHRQGPNNPV
jgi:signal transduction histidine kinase/CheY-like chemotaxis protein